MNLVVSLHLKRDELKKQAKAARRKVGRKKKAVVPMRFASPELEKIFNEMPEECRRLIMKGE
jgi:hypothetical protein